MGAKSRSGWVFVFVWIWVSWVWGACWATGGEGVLVPRWERELIDGDFPGGYQVEVADVNGDGRPDLVALGGGTCAWYENPGWRKRIVTGPDRTPGIITSATRDLDGDGRAEILIGYEFGLNTPSRGRLGLARRPSGEGVSWDEPWEFLELGEVPSVHRLRFVDTGVGGRPLLVSAPLLGPKASPPSDHEDLALIEWFAWEEGRGGGLDWGRPRRGPLGRRPVLHAIETRDAAEGAPARLLTADNLGVAEIALDGDLAGMSARVPREGSHPSESLTAGTVAAAPNRGASEIHAGRSGDGTRFLATIEPWHGTRVVATRLGEGGAAPTREVLDEGLGEGHALWVADLDGDGDDEILAGDRGPAARVTLYDRDRATGRWVRSVLDEGIAAQDLRGGDLDGDGWPDVAAIGGRTGNLVLYRFRGR